MGAVDIGDVVRLQAFFPPRLESFGDHDRSEIRAADSDVDHVGKNFAGEAFLLSAANRFGEGAHLLENGVDFGHDILTVHFNGSVGTISQGHMKNGSVFGNVDFVALEHLLDEGFDLAVFRQLEEKLQSLVGDEVLGKIDQHCFVGPFEALKAVGVDAEELLEVSGVELPFVFLQGFPACKLIGFRSGLSRMAHRWRFLIQR